MFSLQNKKFLNWTSNTYSTIQCYRLLAVAELAFILITEIEATYTRPYIILNVFQHVKPDGPKLTLLGTKLGCDSLIDAHWSGFTIHIGDILIACPNFKDFL